MYHASACVRAVMISASLVILCYVGIKYNYNLCC